ncbi:response regulator transcription factor [Nocardia sp. NPDC020380]|uniref:response regulator transcription factor n=1 Tax=Nocardia sp. NPDC020380 TaxID=3364309 RepID=UPI0037A62714
MPLARCALGTDDIWAVTSAGVTRLGGAPAHDRAPGLHARLVALVRAGARSGAFLWRETPDVDWERVILAEPPAGAELSCPAVAYTTRPPHTYQLTNRELEVLTLIARGYDNRSIARRLEMSVRTVTTHVERILAKLGAGSRTELAVRAIREGLLVCLGEEPPLLDPSG